MKKSRIFKITFCSIMAAMSTVLTLLEVNLPVFNVALYGLPLVIVSVVFGPSFGLLTGFIAGSIEQISKGLSLQSLIWIIAPLAWGGLSGLVYHGLKKLFKDDKTYKKIIYYILGVFFAILVANICNSAAMAIFAYTKEPITSLSMFLVYAVSRMASIPLHIVVYVPICFIVCEKLKKHINVGE